MVYQNLDKSIIKIENKIMIIKKIRDQLAKEKDRKLAMVGFPFDKNSSFLFGAAKAPDFIRQAFQSDSSNQWSETGINLENTMADLGNIQVAENYFAKIESTIEEILNQGQTPISLGGDHSITYPIIKAFRKKFSSFAILQFDAHPDLYDSLDGNRHSHACPFARIMENKLAHKLVQVGIRTMNGHQREQALKFGVEVIEMHKERKSILEFDTPLYISFDMDVLDPAFAPGVSHHEPGGFSTREIISLIQSIKAPQVIGFDIVELNPTRDPLGITAMAAAKVLKELAAKALPENAKN